MSCQLHSRPSPCVAQVLPGPAWRELYDNVDDEEFDALLHPDMLLVNAMASKDHRRAYFVEELVQGGVPLESVYPESGDTALGMAVTLNDVQVGAASCLAAV
jgi:hypothetical protein